MTADLLAWNAEIERARAAYDDDPFAATREGLRACRACLTRRHDRCNTQAWTRAGSADACLCWVYDHEETTA